MCFLPAIFFPTQSDFSENIYDFFSEKKRDIFLVSATSALDFSTLDIFTDICFSGMEHM